MKNEESTSELRIVNAETLNPWAVSRRLPYTATKTFPLGDGSALKLTATALGPIEGAGALQEAQKLIGEYVPSEDRPDATTFEFNGEVLPLNELIIRDLVFVLKTIRQGATDNFLWWVGFMISYPDAYGKISNWIATVNQRGAAAQGN